jgi:hypothetical protein
LTPAQAGCRRPAQRFSLLKIGLGCLVAPEQDGFRSGDKKRVGADVENGIEDGERILESMRRPNGYAAVRHVFP